MINKISPNFLSTSSDNTVKKFSNLSGAFAGNVKDSVSFKGGIERIIILFFIYYAIINYFKET